MIVITTKTGTSARPTVGFNGNTNVQQRPNLLNMPVISSPDYIELEAFLFDKGYYDPILQSGGGIPPVPVTPVVGLLAGIRQGIVDEALAREQLEQMKSRDVYRDLREYFYQPAISQQYALQVSGKSGPNSYYLSGGYDGGTASLKGNHNQRLTLRTRNVFQVTSTLQVEAGMNFTNSLNRSGGNLGTGFRAGTKGLYPYAQLVNSDGTARALEYEYRQQYTDTAGGGRLLDWQYRPLDEIYASEQRHRTTDVVVNTGLNYQLFPFLQAALKYQYQRAVGTNSALNSMDSYYTRNLINRYYQPGAAIEFPVPQGGIQNNSTDELQSHQARIQLNLQHRFEGPHRISGLAGWEIKDQNRETSRYRVFGYNRMGSQVYPNMDFVTRYPMFTNPGQRATIPNVQSIDETTDRFMSLFVNSSYTYLDRYTVSASLREDAANLFGVATNQKGVPLWSAGIRWQAGEEPFYTLGWLPRLDVRLTYGVAGNFSRMVSALTTVTYGTNAQGLPAATINNPPNKDLRWEQNRTFNLAVDIGLAGEWLNGSVEYYTKRNNDLMAEAPVDPTYGLTVGTKSSFFGNVAAIAGKGLEVQLHTNLREGAFRWNGSLLFSRAQTWITAYFMPRSTQASSYTGSQFNLLEGYPVYTQFSYRWAGLDPQNGDPVGILNGEESKTYSNIINQTAPDSLVYNGPAQAPYFGAFRNSFSWKGVSISCNISYRFGHIFRRNSIQYGGLYGSWTGHSDYALRWREPGDEAHTDVPSLVYPAISQRDQFYSRAAVLAESAAVIRLEDIRLDYTFTPGLLQRTGIRSCQVYGYLRNPGVMHAFNSRGIDPTYQNGSAPGMSVAAGLNISF